MDHNITISLIVKTGLIVFASFFFHELAHYLMGTAFGYEMILTMNTANLKEGSFNTDFQRQMVSAAGPIFTIITAVIAFVILRARDNFYAYIILFAAFFMRLMAAAVSTFNPNDEARISEALGIGMMTLPIVVSVFLFGLLFWTVRKHDYNWKINIALFFIISAFTTLNVLLDQYVIKPWVYS